MKIPSWMITDEMKLTDHYRMYVVVFGVDVPMTQLQPIESTHGTHRTSSAPRSPNPETDEGESSAPRKSIVIRLHIPQRRSTRLTPPTPIPTTVEADDIILQDTIQLSLAKRKTENVENVEVNSSTLRQDDTQTILDTKLEPSSDKESPEVEITAAKQPVNVIKKEEESAEDNYELRRKEKGRHVEESKSTLSLTTIRSPRNHSTLIYLHTKKLQELTVTDPLPSSSTPSSSSSKLKLSATNRLLYLFKPKTGRFKRYRSFFDELQGQYEIMEESFPTMVDDRVKEHIKTQVPVYVPHGLIMERQQSQADVIKMIADAIQQERDNLLFEISLQINDAISNHIPSEVDSSVRNYMSGHILHVHPTQATPTSIQEQQQQLYLTIRDNPQLQQDDLPIWLTLKYKFERLHAATTPYRPSVTPSQGGNTRRNVMGIITTQWCQQ
ncbi:hypothetical protein Tco_1043541 [Tanacetum coccineum]|uniref:Uncharacterized protein n=1 Tax=Tanacetum coccineum TaxID=301880 RepID=A0ABQ5GMB6_9ASTR